MKISFLIYRDKADEYLADWEWMERNPLGGTEASVLRVARALRDRGHEVLVTNRPVDLAHGSDVFVSTRGWEIFSRRIRPGRLNYLWCHDDVDQPFVQGLADRAVATTVYDTVDGVFVLSEYHRSRWEARLNLPREKAFLTPNGIPSDKFPTELGDRPRWLYYGSTPFRGLDVLLRNWPAIRAAVPDAELHVFSSMQIYGVPDQPAFQAMYEKARGEPGTHYHGARGQVAIREIAGKCRVLAYPCTFPETCCIAAMEAMASGCAVVTTDLGALPETARGNVLVPAGTDWDSRWRDAVVKILTDDDAWRRIGTSNLALTAGRSWDVVAGKWLERFERDAARRVPRY